MASTGRETDVDAHPAADALAALDGGLEAPLLDRVERGLLEGEVRRLQGLRVRDLAGGVDEEGDGDAARDLLAAHLGGVERARLEDRARLLVDLGEAEGALHLVVERAGL